MKIEKIDIKKEILEEFEKEFVCDTDPEEFPFVAHYNEEENKFEFWNAYKIKDFITKALTSYRQHIEEKEANHWMEIIKDKHLCAETMKKIAEKERQEARLQVEKKRINRLKLNL